jgi:hypothetical protein
LLNYPALSFSGTKAANHRYQGVNMHPTRVIVFYALVLRALVPAQDSVTASSGMIPLPPLTNGGLTSLWYDEHKYLDKEYGEFELLNYGNSGFKTRRDSLTAYSWQLVAMGDFVEKSVSYATLARVRNHPGGLLLIMFKWHDPADTARAHGIYFQTFIGKEKLLLRTKQCTTGGVDTLEISCGDLKRSCGKCWFDPQVREMVVEMAEKK